MLPCQPCTPLVKYHNCTETPEMQTFALGTDRSQTEARRSRTMPAKSDANKIQISSKRRESRSDCPAFTVALVCYGDETCHRVHLDDCDDFEGEGDVVVEELQA